MPDELLNRYRHLRVIRTRHHSASLKFLARPTILEHARRLRLAGGQVLVADSAGEMTLVFRPSRSTSPKKADHLPVFPCGY
jgi:hypothetical protein